LTKSKFDDSLKKKFLITLAWGKTGNQSQQRKIDGRKKTVGPHVKKDEEKPAWTGWESHVLGGSPSNVKSTEEKNGGPALKKAKKTSLDRVESHVPGGKKREATWFAPRVGSRRGFDGGSGME
jgi:hypothetical protein